ncbi:hypothetical protein ElP_12870 [Tautonia plasticadhaerens]|uniref:SGNH hydrolase-type esterase domain-containing protein n=2 Tax=Tautonia plasticadhaerens TaxID=2527974 RepID=A0A518GXU1_9BACT|nr:hypothetical protein ElP_12870 [Tautonia plasticadhaerens]
MPPAREPARPRRSFLVAGCSLGIASVALAVADPGDPDPMRFSDEIRAFEEADESSPPAPGQVLFVGSSSIRRWDLSGSFTRLDALNRGFGGSQLSDVLHFADRVIGPYRPRAIVLYAGDNDIKGGKTAERVREDVLRLARRIRELAPDALVHFLAIKPSPSRAEFWPEMRRANALIEQASRSDDRLNYVDVATPMLGPDGEMRPELYVEDRLHLSGEGYDLWADVLAPHLRKPGPPGNEPRPASTGG